MKISDNLFFFGLIASVPVEFKIIEFNPWLGLVLPVILAGYLALKIFPRVRRKRARIAASVGAFLSLLMMGLPSQALEFSLLLGRTEEMVSTCIFGQLDGFNIATFLVFGIIRMFYIVPLALEVAEWNKKRSNNQNFSEEIKFIGIAIVGMLFVGVLEPFFVKNCGG